MAYPQQRPRAIFSGLVEQFYNPQKGGLQLAGIAGGLAAGIFMFTKLGAASWTARLALLVGTALGAYVMNKSVEAIGGSLKKPDAKTPAGLGQLTPAPAQDLSQSQGLNTPLFNIPQEVRAEARGATPQETTVQQAPITGGNTNNLPHPPKEQGTPAR